MTDKPGKDGLYADKHEMLVDFVFDEQVAHVFPDMIRRSVPGYDNLVPLLGLIAERFVTPGTTVYDLGCSLGASTISIRRRIQQPGCRIIAVDNAEAMVSQCKENIAADRNSSIPVQVLCEDIRNTSIEDASLVVMNFTLQFITPADRQTLLNRIAAGLQTGGALVLSEKIVSDDASEQKIIEELHMAFKRANGYSELEISQKRTALENVLIPDSIDTHTQRLLQAGFCQVITWQRCLNFVSLLAIK